LQVAMKGGQIGDDDYFGQAKEMRMSQFEQVALGRFWSNIEILVIRARSEIIGCVVQECGGMMEFWNVGIMGLAEWCLILWDM